MLLGNIKACLKRGITAEWQHRAQQISQIGNRFVIHNTKRHINTVSSAVSVVRSPPTIFYNGVVVYHVGGGAFFQQRQCIGSANLAGVMTYMVGLYMSLFWQSNLKHKNNKRLRKCQNTENTTLFS